MSTHIFILLLPVAFGQYSIDTGMKPDVRFDDKNDRFDLSALMNAGEFEVKDYRRQTEGSRYNQLTYYDRQNTQNLLRLLEKNMGKSSKNNAIVPHLVQLLHQVARRAGDDVIAEDWAWHDDMKSVENQDNYERNLEKLRLGEGRRNLVDYLHDGQLEEQVSRRSGAEPDEEVLMHHAVPIVMKINGFLQAPTVT